MRQKLSKNITKLIKVLDKNEKLCTVVPNEGYWRTIDIPEARVHSTSPVSIIIIVTVTAAATLFARERALVTVPVRSHCCTCFLLGSVVCLRLFFFGSAMAIDGGEKKNALSVKDKHDVLRAVKKEPTQEELRLAK